MKTSIIAESVSDLRKKISAWKVLFRHAPCIQTMGTFTDDGGELIFLASPVPVDITRSNAWIVITTNMGEVLRVRFDHNQLFYFIKD